MNCGNCNTCETCTWRLKAIQAQEEVRVLREMVAKHVDDSLQRDNWAKQWKGVAKKILGEKTELLTSEKSANLASEDLRKNFNQLSEAHLKRTKTNAETKKKYGPQIKKLTARAEKAESEALWLSGALETARKSHVELTKTIAELAQECARLREALEEKK